jgi:hypothetical protein
VYVLSLQIHIPDLATNMSFAPFHTSFALGAAASSSSAAAAANAPTSEPASAPNPKKRATPSTARVPTLRELCFSAAATPDNVLLSLRQLPTSMHGELFVLHSQQQLEPMQNEVKKLRSEVARLEREKVSWNKEILSMPVEKQAHSGDREFLAMQQSPSYFNPAPMYTSGPLSLVRCSTCGCARATTLQRQYNPSAGVLLCNECAREVSSRRGRFG